MNNKNESLDALLRQFMDPSQVREFQDDLSAADHLFQSHPVKSVDAQVLHTVQARMLRAFRQHRYWIAAKWCMSAAAVIIGTMVAGLFVLYSPNNVSEPVIATSQPVKTVQPRFWSDTLYAVAMETDPIELELAELTQSIQSVRVNPYDEPTDTFSLDMKEIDEIESLTEESNFWKGLQI